MVFHLVSKFAQQWLRELDAHSGLTFNFVANKFYCFLKEFFFQARELMENEKQLPDIRLQARRIHTVLFGTKPEL